MHIPKNNIYFLLFKISEKEEQLLAAKKQNSCRKEKEISASKKQNLCRKEEIPVVKEQNLTKKKKQILTKQKLLVQRKPEFNEKVRKETENNIKQQLKEFYTKIEN